MGILGILRDWQARHLRGTLPEWRPQDAGGGHVVQFYGGPFPAAAVARFLKQGIDAGEVCLVIAEPRHIVAVDRLLGDQRGKCIYLDAQATMNKFMVNGRPDPVRFMDTVGDLVEQAAQAGGGTVRAFGEMVVLLCRQGSPQAAHDLEQLWNDLGRRHHLRLLCSYPIGVLDGRGKGMAATLRDAHSHHVLAGP